MYIYPPSVKLKGKGERVKGKGFILYPFPLTLSPSYRPGAGLRGSFASRMAVW